MKYDLLDVVLVYISTKDDEQKDELCGMLEVLLDETTDKDTRMEKLEKQYGMKRTVELEGRLRDMDYSVGIANKYLKKGREEGQNQLANAIKRLKSGETDEQLLKSGVDEKTVNLAKACL